MNKVILTGHLGRDPEIKYLQDGTPVANVTMATTKYWKDRSGNKAEKTEWHNLVFWRANAVNAAKYLQKGSKIFVEGEIQYRDWEDKDGIKRKQTEIHVVSVEYLTSPINNQQQQPNQNNRPQPSAQSNQYTNYVPGSNDDVPF